MESCKVCTSKDRTSENFLELAYETKATIFKLNLKATYIGLLLIMKQAVAVIIILQPPRIMRPGYYSTLSMYI